MSSATRTTLAKICYAVLMLVAVGCSRMSTVTFQVLQPAAITLGSNLHTVLIINRSLPENKKLNAVEGILTGEGIGEDHQNEQQIVAGLGNGLMNSPRFTAKLCGREWAGSGTGNVFPQPLNWQIINELCTQNNVDGIVALETFDSDYTTQTGSRDVQKTGKDGVKYMSKEFFADQTVHVKYGIRIYNNINKNLEDQFIDSYSNTWHTKGTALQDALNSMINRRAAVSQSCYLIGQNFATRISPNWSSVARRFYKKGSPEMEKAGRLAMVGSWKEAAGIWKEQLANHDTKIAGGAAYNMAVYFETQEDLISARQWAIKSFADYKNFKALQYSQILDQRIGAQQKLDNQMKAQTE